MFQGAHLVVGGRQPFDGDVAAAAVDAAAEAAVEDGGRAVRRRIGGAVRLQRRDLVGGLARASHHRPHQARLGTRWHLWVCCNLSSFTSLAR